MGNILDEVAKNEEANLQDILESERKEWQEMPWWSKASRKIKNKIVRSHEFRDNDFKYNNGVVKKLPRIVVYACITGGYDGVVEPDFSFGNIDYVLFTDTELKSKKWQIKKIPEECKQGSAVLTNRYIKMHPGELFSAEKYDYAIYVDGNIKVVGDLTPLVYAAGDLGLAFHRHAMRDDIRKEVLACISQKKGDRRKMLAQIKEYGEAGFPRKYGMLECNMIVSNLGSETAKEILDAWWAEFLRSGSMRDQIALPYVLWQKGYVIDDIGNLGYNIYRNPKVRKMEHGR